MRCLLYSERRLGIRVQDPAHRCSQWKEVVGSGEHAPKLVLLPLDDPRDGGSWSLGLLLKARKHARVDHRVVRAAFLTLPPLVPMKELAMRDGSGHPQRDGAPLACAFDLKGLVSSMKMAALPEEPGHCTLPRLPV